MTLIKTYEIPLKPVSANATYNLSKTSKKGEKHIFVSPEALEFRRVVKQVVLDSSMDETMTLAIDKLDCPLLVRIEAYYRTKHSRDVDNVLKGTLDALTQAGVWTDDNIILEVQARKFEGYGEDKTIIKIYSEVI